MKTVAIVFLLLLFSGCGLHKRQNVSIDPMTGEKSATFSVNAAVEKRYGQFKIVGIFFSVSKLNSIVCVMGHNFPGKQAMIRIDNEPPITMGKKGCMKLSVALSRRFINAKSLRVKGYIFPSDIPLIGDINMDFYEEKIKWARAQAGIKRSGGVMSRYPKYEDEELEYDYYYHKN